MRKYIAIGSQLLELKEVEADWIARHLGHDAGIVNNARSFTRTKMRKHIATGSQLLEV